MWSYKREMKVPNKKWKCQTRNESAKQEWAKENMKLEMNVIPMVPQQLSPNLYKGCIKK